MWWVERNLPVTEYYEWMAFFRIDPWHREREESMLAQIASLLYNANRRKGKPAKRLKDFMPDYERGLKPRQTVQHMFDTLKVLGERTGRLVRKNGEKPSPR